MKVSITDLRRALRHSPRIGGADLCRTLKDINRSTLARLVAQMDDEIVRRGGSRRTRYALRRPLRGRSQSLPLYRIDAEGAGHSAAHLDLTYPEGSALSFDHPFQWPLDKGEMQDGWFDGLPYPILDMRPQGFLGRNFSHAYWQTLDVPENLNHWTDDDIVHALSIYGSDQSGDLILGDRAYQRHLDARQDWESGLVKSSTLASAYPNLAIAALSNGNVGSSAGGEFPKFTAVREMSNTIMPVIVKFSGVGNSPAIQRWADLLICEHLALQTVQSELKLAAAQSAIHLHEGRTFLEVVRFDRVGPHGRIPLCSLDMANGALLGQAGASWPAIAHMLQRKAWLTPDDVERIARLWWFGKLIANTDMHEGNLSFYPGLALAPAYDMLPMRYAPLRGGEVADQSFSLALPLPSEIDAWQRAAQAAIIYWQRCASDKRISAPFRKICAANAETVKRGVGDFKPA